MWVAPQSVHARLAGQQRAVGYVDPRGGTRSLHGLASVLQAGMTELGPPVTFTTSVISTDNSQKKATYGWSMTTQVTQVDL